ncbi:cell filamentation protein Fic [Candidatus Dependentiae bacterium]|nr:MAG: cell filamentation protein Fic [Candidatus Dependentiae bacterium]
MSLSLLLKEIDQLKKEISEIRPLDEYMCKQIKEYFRIGLTYSSNALEGNSLTISETKVVLEEGITIGGKPLRDHLEAVGHSQAYDFLYNCIQNKTFSEGIIQKLHYIFYHRIDVKHAGIYRSVQAYITGSKHALPLPKEISQLMSLFIQKYKNQEEHPVITAARIHKDFVYIHPFIDGNGRVARLLMNLILLQHGYTIALIPPIIRSEYIQALENGREDDSSFVILIAEMVKESQKDYLRLFS